jgi:hypothetical protein
VGCGEKARKKIRNLLLKFKKPRSSSNQLIIEVFIKHSITFSRLVLGQYILVQREQGIGNREHCFGELGTKKCPNF